VSCVQKVVIGGAVTNGSVSVIKWDTWNSWCYYM